MSTFTCKLCGKTHEGFVEPSPEFTPEEVEKRKAAWLAAETKFDRDPKNEHFEKAHQKAWFAYMATKSSGVERVPDTITTRKGPDGFYFACTSHWEAMLAETDDSVQR